MADDKKVYSIDQALEEQKHYIELRGETYPLADHTTDDSLRLYRKILLTQRRLEERAEEGDAEAIEDEDIEDLQTMVQQTVQLMLEGVPDEVAASVTEAEFEILQRTVEQIKEEGFHPAEEEIREVEEEGKD